MRHFTIILLMLFSCGTILGQELTIGAAKRLITPNPLLPVSGGVGIPKPAHTKAGDLWVRAMVVQQGTEKLAIVSIDNIGWPALLGDETRKLVPEIPADHILIGATHTHSAPDAYGFPDAQGNSTADQDYLQFCIVQMAEAIKEALASAIPAKVKINMGEAKGKIAYNYYAPDLYDPRASVLQAIDLESDTVIATLVNYAIHPEVLGNDLGILSPDLCGPLYDRIESKVGGVAIFMNGAQGGMVTADNRRPAMREVQNYEECQRIGYILADESLRIVNEVEAKDNLKLEVFSESITFPVTSPLMKQLIQALNYGEKRGDQFTVTTQLNLVNLGSAKMLTIPGEALPNIGYYLKRKMKTDQPFLLGLTNDAFGYILTKEDYDSFKRYDYISRTSLGERTGEILIDHALQMIEKYPAPINE